MRVLGLAKYGARAASTRQRMLQYRPHLASKGIDIEIRALLGDDYIERLAQGTKQPRSAILSGYIRRIADLMAARRFDVLWVQYEAFPYLPGAVERALTLLGVPIVYDIDDAIFHMYDRHRSNLVKRVLGNKLVPLLRGASACLCGNEYLRSYTAQYCPNSIVVPTVVDTDDYRPSNRLSLTAAPVVGWIGSPSTWRYVEPLLPTLLPLFARHGVLMRVVGAGPRAQGIAGIDAVDWDEAREVIDIQSMDIGIMPLPDEPWARGKCGYKLIQYMACGLPVVASPVGVNCDIVSDGCNGFLVTEADQWVAALKRLITEPDLRHTFGKDGARVVEARYSLRSQQDRVAATLKQAGSERHR
ncbi:glycosyltransferase family 4 protein [uncultured Sphingomonas sp.]|uniref:glycosyltransferase family 4 protein n=1 Tax=uncultured Sphingomonas sp. TaxID=158754 RepID=UPI0025F8950F|nr:glycosyltransferase family 4 protein [uncultured Sphingomonas sp.]